MADPVPAWRRTLVRSAALLVMLLSAAAIVLSVVGAAAVWAVNEPVTRAALAVVEPVERRLARTEARIGASRESVASVRRRIEAAEETVADVGATLSDPAALRDEIVASISERLEDRLSEELDLRLGKTRLGEIGDALRSAVGGQGSDDATGVTPEPIASRTAARVSPTPPPADAGGPRPGLDLGISATLAAARAEVQKAEDALAEYEAEIGLWHRRVATVADNLPRWIDLLSIAATGLFVWLAVVHAAAFGVALGFFTGVDPFASWRRWAGVARQGAYTSVVE